MDAFCLGVLRQRQPHLFQFAGTGRVPGRLAHRSKRRKHHRAKGDDNDKLNESEPFSLVNFGIEKKLGFIRKV